MGGIRGRIIKDDSSHGQQDFLYKKKLNEKVGNADDWKHTFCVFFSLTHVGTHAAI